MRTHHLPNRHILELEHRGRRAVVSCSCGFRVNCSSLRRAGVTLRRHRQINVIDRGPRFVRERSRSLSFWNTDFVTNWRSARQSNNDLMEVELEDGTTALVPAPLFFDRGPAEWSD